MIHIYTLADPETNTIKYVGKAKCIKTRYYSHLSCKKCNKVCNWIKSLRKRNLKPIIEELDYVEDIGWEFWESFYIDLLRSWGFTLKNMTNGGETGIISDKCRLAALQKLKGKIGNRKGKKHSDEAKIKIKEARSKQVITEEHKNKTSKKMKGILKSPSMKEKLSLNQWKIRRVGKFNLEGNLLEEYHSVKIANENTIRKSTIFYHLRKKTIFENKYYLEYLKN